MNAQDPDAAIVVLSTVPPERAESLVDRLLDARLIACANLVGPVRSRYRWRGRVEQADEVLLVLKTTAARARELRERLAEWHGYEVPEVLELAVHDGHAPYLAWLAGECRG